MGCPTMKKCCCLELKWGAFIVAILDAIMAASVAFDCHSLGRWGGSMEIIWIVIMIVHLAHIVCCILVIVSVFKPNKNLVLPYLITGIIRIIFDIIVFIYYCIEIEFEFPVTMCLILVGICLAAFFWYVIYSWFKKLGGSTPLD